MLWYDHAEEQHCLHSHQKSLRGAKYSHPHDELACQSAAQLGRQTYIMFWADCSSLLPMSGSAIVARAKWMGSEPERVLNKTPLASNKRLECILNCAVFTGSWHISDIVRTSTQSHSRKQKWQSTLNKHEKTSAAASLSILSIPLHPPSSFCTEVASSTAGLLPCRSGQQ